MIAHIMTSKAAVGYMANDKNVTPGYREIVPPDFGELGVNPDNNEVRPKQILLATQIGLTNGTRIWAQSVNSEKTFTNLGGVIKTYPNNRILSAPVVSFLSTGTQGASNQTGN